MNLWITTCLAALSLRLVAAEAPLLDLNDRPALEWAVNDNPKSLQARAKKEFEAIDLNKDARRWVRALWLHATLVSEWKEMPDARKLIEQGIVVAERENMPEELLAFKGFLPGIMEELAQNTNRVVDSKAVIKEYETMIADAKRIGVKRAEAEALASYAFYIRDLGETTRSLQLLLDASKLLAEDPKATELNKMNMKNNLALAYSYQNEERRAKDLYMEIDAFCARAKLRSFCLTNDYNLAKLLVDQDDPSQLPKAEAYFMKSLKAAQEINDKWSVATSHSGLISLHMKNGAFDKAFKEADTAIALFKETQNNVWLADSYKKGAKALIGMKNHAKALEYIAEAHRLFPEGYRKDFDDLEDLSYQAYRGLGQTEKALEHLEKHNAEFKKMTSEREKSDYSKLMVGMGLAIEEEKNKVLSMDNELKNQKLAETERLRMFMIAMMGLSVLVMGSMGVAVMRSREVKQSRTKMQRILSNIEEGILTVNSQLEIESEYSRYLTVLLGTKADLSGQPALQLLLEKTSLKDEDKSMVHEALHASLGADELQWFANEQHLPLELIYPGNGAPRIVAVHWQPLYDKHERVQSVLIGLIDVTERRKLEAEIALERQRSDRQGRLIQELAQAEAARVDGALHQAKALEPQLAAGAPEGRVGILRELHTIKGIARVLGLKELSAEAHELEESLQKSSDAQQIAARRKQFIATVNDCLSIVEQIFGRRGRGTHHNRTLHDLVQAILPGVSAPMHEAGLHLQSLEIRDRVMQWTPALLQTLEQILVHALSNSADHGFILPQKRGVTTPNPGFEIEAQRRGRNLELLVRDNGAGLDLPRLQALAQKMNFVPMPGRSVADVVFLDGSTTAEQVSRTSGRGIGMAAIRGLCQQWGGEVHLEPNPQGPGAQLLVILPLETLKATA